MIRKIIKKFINKMNREIKNNKSETRFIENELVKIKIKVLELVLSEADKMKCKNCYYNRFCESFVIIDGAEISIKYCDNFLLEE